ncbi:MAG TPA: LysR family transcriptional regulator [Candidatus Limnocylindria bacterium]|nr:LysR family transcriptional regulator [Candidatus Limnocylindria bacterium]
MNTDRLQAFCLVGQNGGLLRAAQKLKLSPATVSLRLKHLENELGVQLFERRPNKLLLTDKGKLFLTQAQRILQQIDDSVASLREEQGRCEGNVSVLVGSDMAHFFAPRIARFVESYPQVNLKILVNPSPDSLELLIGGQGDFAIGRFLKVPRSLATFPLFTSSIAAIFDRNHPLAQRKRITLRDLAGCGLIVTSLYSAIRRIVQKAFASQGLEMRTVLETGECSLISEYTKMKLGVGLVHEACIQGKLDANVRARDLKHLFGRLDVVLLYRKDRLMTAAQKKFIEAISAQTELGKIHNAGA